MLLFDGAGVGHQLLADFEVHQRFAAEEVHFQVAAGAGMLDQEVQRPLAGLEAHQAGFAVELALGREAVFAVEVAGVGHMQAEGLDHSGAVFEVEGVGLVDIGGEKAAVGGELVDVGQAVGDLGFGDLGVVAVFGQQLLGDLGAGGAGVHQGDGVVGQLVHRVDAAAVHIHHDVVAVEFVLMDHSKNLGTGRRAL